MACFWLNLAILRPFLMKISSKLLEKELKITKIGEKTPILVQKQPFLALFGPILAVFGQFLQIAILSKNSKKVKLF